jgi:hypothetical protein
MTIMTTKTALKNNTIPLPSITRIIANLRAASSSFCGRLVTPTTITTATTATIIIITNLRAASSSSFGRFVAPMMT